MKAQGHSIKVTPFLTCDSRKCFLGLLDISVSMYFSMCVKQTSLIQINSVRSLIDEQPLHILKKRTVHLQEKCFPTLSMD